MGELTLARVKLMHKEFYIHVYASLKTYPLERPTGDRRFFRVNYTQYKYTLLVYCKSDCSSGLYLQIPFYLQLFRSVTYMQLFVRQSRLTLG